MSKVSTVVVFFTAFEAIAVIPPARAKHMMHERMMKGTSLVPCFTKMKIMVARNTADKKMIINMFYLSILNKRLRYST